jgi:hypothetical protein
VNSERIGFTFESGYLRIIVSSLEMAQRGSTDASAILEELIHCESRVSTQLVNLFAESLYEIAISVSFASFGRIHAIVLLLQM